MGDLERRRLERRIQDLEDQVAWLPKHKRPEEKAKRLECHRRAYRAYKEGATEPPDSHPDTLVYWKALRKYYPVVQDMEARGILRPRK